MEHAWDYFKTTEEIFKTIMRTEEDFIITLMKKKYGKDFDGINIKTTIKKKELTLFKLAEEIIKIDLEYINKLINNQKKYQNYFNRMIGLNIKIEYIQNINHDELIKRINTLANPKKDAILYAFGIDQKKMSFYALSEYFNCTQEEIIQAIIDCLHDIVKYEPKDVENLIPNNFIMFLKKKGYTLEDFKKKINNFTLQEINCLKRLYGNNYSSSIPCYDKITIQDQKTMKKILQQLDPLRIYLDSLYVKYDFNKNDLKRALNSLDSELKEEMKKYIKFENLEIIQDLEKFSVVERYLHSSFIVDMYYLRLVNNENIDTLNVPITYKKNAERKYKRYLTPAENRSLPNSINLLHYYSRFGFSKSDIIRTILFINQKKKAELEECINLETLEITDKLSKHPAILAYLYRNFVIQMYYLKLVNNENVKIIIISDVLLKRASDKYQNYLRKSEKPTKNKTEDIRKTKKYKIMSMIFCQYYISLGYEEKKVLNILKNNLTDEEVCLLINSYVECGNEDNAESIEIIQKRILKIVQSQEERPVLITSFEEYIEYLKKLNIINREFIEKYSFSLKEKFYLMLEFVWNYDNLYSIDEITEYFNIKKELFCQELLSSIKVAIKLSNLNYQEDEILKKLINEGEQCD